VVSLGWVSIRLGYQMPNFSYSGSVQELFPTVIQQAREAESAGFDAAFVMDHFYQLPGIGAPDEPMLESYSTLSALATATSRIQLSALVTGNTYRNPAMLAKTVTTLDVVSGGRAVLGIGAGWFELEHVAYGFPFHDTKTRLDMLAEQIEIVHRSWEDGSFSFEGEHYRIEELDALPKPLQKPHPTLLVGGMGGRRTLEPAARWADEYNTFSASPDAVRERRGRFAELWEREERDPDALRFSAMVTIVIGTDDAEVRARAEKLPEQLRDNGVTGTVEQVAEQLRELEDAGVQRVMLQHLQHTDLETIELIGRELIPKIS
jgi:F420-dependent oxidoreductase-like protein